MPAGPRLDALIAERIFGWKDIERHSQDYRGKKQDKAGRWRSARVPDYSSDARFASDIEQRMRELKRFERYEKELAKVARNKGLPAGWASPDQRCRAALKAVKRGAP
ncbi:MAG TPA: hypothetical protein VFU31_21885 [Candidatus Binatia bacterium]|nr:hypothetical protein [Candidatus Binatia bacterium]